MAYNFSQLNTEIKGTIEWLQKEYTSIRTGKANTAFLDNVKVDSYGSMMAINQVAAISTEDARTVRISPWDSTMVQPIEKAINVANLGVAVSVDDKGLRVIFPELTGERREQLVKMAKQKLEDAKIAIRGERNKVSDDLNKKKKDAVLGEDEMMRHKAEMEKICQEGNKKLEELFAKKETEITQ